MATHLQQEIQKDKNQQHTTNEARYQQITETLQEKPKATKRGPHTTEN